MRKFVFAVAVTTLFAAGALAENWPQWRGPLGTGVAPGTGYPVEWSETENVAWKITLPGPGASTPAIWGDSIFLTCGGKIGENLLVCLNRDGKTRWERSLGDEVSGKNKKGTGSNPSPATDGKRVYAYFKSGDLACVDFDGEVVWRKNVQQMYGEDKLWWDLGTSPVLTKDYVVVACMHGGPSYLAAFDKETGKVAWKTDRNVDAPLESNDSYTTPVVFTDGEEETIVTLGGDHVTGHDAKTGEELWRVGGLNPSGNMNFRSISSPVLSGSLVIAPYARGDTLTAIRLGGKGDVTESHVMWIKDRIGADVPTPVAVDGKLYVSRDHQNRGQIVCLDAQSGETLWQRRLAGSRIDFTSSPVLADGRLYVTREDGTTFVLDVAEEGKVIATNELAGEFTVATPVFVDGQILIRTRESLYCIGERSTASK
jgi:outer membrane protein assembly factor BamB